MESFQFHGHGLPLAWLKAERGTDKAQKAFLSSVSVETLSLSILQTDLCCIKT